MLVTDTEVIPAPSETFAQIVEQFEKADEMLADPNFDPIKIGSDLRDKVDRLNFFINEYAKERRETYKKVGQKYSKTGLAMENNIKRLSAYIVETMLAQKLKKGDSYPGNLKRLQLMQKPDRFEIDSEAGPQFFLKYPQFCEVVVTRSYKWNIEAVEQAFEAKTLPDDIIASVKEGNYFPQFFNNVKPKKSKTAAKKAPKKELSK